MKTELGNLRNLADNECQDLIDPEGIDEIHEKVKDLIRKRSYTDARKTIVFSHQIDTDDQDLINEVDSFNNKCREKINKVKYYTPDSPDPGECEKCGKEAELRNNHCFWCLPEEFTECAYCNELHPNEDISNRNGHNICNKCQETIRICECCGRSMRKNDSGWEEGLGLCYSCAKNKYLRTYNWTRNLSDRDFKTTPEDNTNLFYGVELEVDGGDDFGYTISNLLDIKRDNDIYNFVHDGSLRIGKGFEIVTVPATFHYHMNKFPWIDICNICKDGGYKADSTNTCGLHIHVSREGFGESTASKVNLFIAAYPEFIEKVARRPENYDYAKFKKVEEVELDPTRSESRYEAMNFCTGNKPTIEFRMFQGTLDPKIILGSIEFIESLRNFVQEIDMVELKDNGLDKYMDWMDDTEYNLAKKLI